jgi:stress-induced morphogen
MLPSEIQKRIESRWPGSSVEIRDLTGTSDHWQVTVVSKAFEGKSMLEQHRMVKGLFETEIASGNLHAFSLKTWTPEEWTRRQPPSN